MWLHQIIDQIEALGRLREENGSLNLACWSLTLMLLAMSVLPMVAHILRGDDLYHRRCRLEREQMIERLNESPAWDDRSSGWGRAVVGFRSAHRAFIVRAVSQ